MYLTKVSGGRLSCMNQLINRLHNFAVTGPNRLCIFEIFKQLNLFGLVDEMNEEGLFTLRCDAMLHSDWLPSIALFDKIQSAGHQ